MVKRWLGKPLGSHTKNDIPSFEYCLLPNGDKTWVIVFNKVGVI